MSIVSTESAGVPSKARPEKGLANRSWQQAMRDAIRTNAELLSVVGLDEAGDLARRIRSALNFPVFVPREFASRIERGNPRDPLLLQVLASHGKSTSHSEFVLDPVGDSAAIRDGGLLQKYEGRALWVLTGVCPVHCRYCFRQHFDYAGQAGETERALEWLRSQTDVQEVIFSGGDPLVLDDAKLVEAIAAMDGIPHIKRLRLHTRMPVMIPQRVTKPLVEALSRSRPAMYVVVHINHEAEIDAAVEGALGQLVDAGIPVLNQSVLLAGVNDQLEVLVALSKRLANLRVIPYYLHQLDRVQGAERFEVPIETGKALVQKMQRHLPGYAVPRYVCEIAGEPSKTPLF